MNPIRIKNTTTVVLAFSAISGVFISCNSIKQQPKSSPNIIYILADDLGYGDLGVLGQKMIKTPHLDELASEGMLFTQHYAGSAVCGPSRAVLLSGQHTGHTAIRGNKAFKGIGVAPLDPKIPTLPETIKNNTNYTTAMCGRWHLGGELSDQTPFHRGFDYHFGKLSSDYGNKFGVMIDTLWDENGKHIAYNEYSKIQVEPMYENGKLFNLSQIEMAMRPINMDELVTDKAIRFIQKEKDQPYFLYIAYSLVHSPMEYHSKYPVENTEWPEEERAFASMLMALDDYVGKIVKTVDELGQSDNTIIIFTSDNGAHNHGHDVEFFNSNGDFREYKRSFYEGGFHCPMIVRWPGVVEPNSISNHISAFWDVMPTLCDIAGAPKPEHTDGISFLPSLKGEEQPQHEYLYWEFNEDIYGKKSHFKQAVRKGDWKGIYIIDEDKFELFNLKEDVSEMNDLSAQHPEIVKEMETIMEEAHVPNERFPLLKEERISNKAK
jgi:arylsulfatase A